MPQDDTPTPGSPDSYPRATLEKDPRRAVDSGSAPADDLAVVRAVERQHNSEMLRSQLDFVRHVHLYLQDQIRFVDTKAGALVLFATVGLGLFRERFALIQDGWQAFARPPALDGAARWAVTWLFIGAVLMLLALYAWHLSLVLRPRIPARNLGRGDATPADRARLRPHWLLRYHDLFDAFFVRLPPRWNDATLAAVRSNLVRWPDMLFRTPAEYAEAVRTSDTDALIKQLAEDSVVLGVIADYKNKHLRYALNDVLIAAILFAVGPVLLSGG